MKFKYLYSDSMKYSSIIFLIAVLISVGAISASWIFKENMRAEYTKQSNMFVAVSNKYLSIDSNLAIARQYYTPFLDLYNRGVFGKEHRLNWIEVLHESSERIQLPSLTYSIDAQKEYGQEIPVNFGNFKLYSSTMKINLKMLHEGDLLNFIDDLNAHAEGMFTISECSMSRLSDVLVKQHDATNITAYCELQWLNIHKSDGTVITL